MALRYDTYRVDKKPIKLDSGFLRVPVFATRTGIFRYRRPDGSIRRELRHPDEVFNADSLQSLAGVPFTNRHPSELVNSKNVRKYMVGTVSDKVGRHDDGDVSFVDTSVMVMDEKMIAEVETKGLREVSCGYKCDVEDSPGEFNGEQYDAVQKNIRYNHLAGVDKGRAGSQVRLRMDADDAELVEDGKGDLNHKHTKLNGGSTMRITIDGVEYDTENGATLVSAIQTMQTKHDSALAEAKGESVTIKTDAKKEFDGLQAKFDQLKEDSDKLKKDAEDAPKVTELVKARVALVGAATPHLDKETVEKLEDMSDRDVKLAVIKARNEKFDAEGKSDEYINARYDGIIESDVKPATTEKPKTKLDTALDNVNQGRKEGEERTAEQVRADSMKADENAWQQPLAMSTRQAVGSN